MVHKPIVVGPPPHSVWEPCTAQASTDALTRAVVVVVRTLLIPVYTAARPGDRQPVRALEAAEMYLDRRSEDARRHAAAVAKACSKSRKATFGYEHRIVEAARAVALSVTRKTDAAVREQLHEALSKTEEQLVEMDANEGVYRTRDAHRARILALLGDRLSAG